VDVSVSARKGSSKRPVHTGRLIEEFGLEGDAHAGTPGRQVSLLCLGSIEKIRAGGAEVGPGDFAENLTIEGLQGDDFRVGTVISLDSGAVLKVTQIGKECHSGCEILKLLGDCVMPREGIFARVVKGGQVSKGDGLEVINGEDQGGSAHCER